MNERQQIALGLRPQTAAGWWFWLRTWSPPAIWCANIAFRIRTWQNRAADVDYVSPEWLDRERARKDDE